MAQMDMGCHAGEWEDGQINTRQADIFFYLGTPSLNLRGDTSESAHPGI